MQKIEYTYGSAIGNNGIMILHRTDRVTKSGRHCNYAMFRCRCGKEFETTISDVKLGKVKSCGCAKKGVLVYKYYGGEIINGIRLIKPDGVYKAAQYGIFECPICGQEWRSSINNIKEGNTKSCCLAHTGSSKNHFKKLYKTVTLYKVMLYSDSEMFIKIGVTSRRVKERMWGVPYEYKILKTITGDVERMFNLEYRYKRLNNKHKYKPNKIFKGIGECFTLKS